MPKRFPIKLSVLREIGWTLWDPIGLMGMSEDCADEYDTYLLKAAGMIQNGKSDDDAVAYLFQVQTAYMGVRPVAESEGRERAIATVQAIRAYLAKIDA